MILHTGFREWGDACLPQFGLAAWSSPKSLWTRLFLNYMYFFNVERIGATTPKESKINSDWKNKPSGMEGEDERCELPLSTHTDLPWTLSKGSDRFCGTASPRHGHGDKSQSNRGLVLGNSGFCLFFFIFGKCSELRSFCNSQEYLVSVNLSKKFLFLEIFWASVPDRGPCQSGCPQGELWGIHLISMLGPLF